MRISVQSRGDVVAYATVDLEDFARFDGLRWHLFRGYAARTLNDGSKVLMHREVIGARAGDGMECHHINGDKLDNRRSNLVRTTKAAHQREHGGNGASGYRGVYAARCSPRWVARVKRHGKKITLGTFDTREEASEVVEAWWNDKSRPKAAPSPSAP